MAAMYCGMLTISNGSQLFGSHSYALPMKRNVGLTCLRQGKEDGVTNHVATTPTPVTPSPPMQRKAQPSFSKLLAFSGPAPERINGRLANAAKGAAKLLQAIGLQRSRSGEDQRPSGDDRLRCGVSWFVLTSVTLLTAASLIPLFQGVSVESKPRGLMTSDAELWNGRFAMLGLVALAFTEFVKGSSLG